MGCFKDTGKRAIPTIEGKDPMLDGPYRRRKNAIAKCAIAARRKGFHMFAIQNGGWCAASASAEITFDKYGKSRACRKGGEGGPFANHVYVIKGKAIYCYLLFFHWSTIQDVGFGNTRSHHQGNSFLFLGRSNTNSVIFKERKF